MRSNEYRKQKRSKLFSKTATTNGITGFVNLSSHQQHMKGRSFLEAKGVKVLLKENKLYSELFTPQRHFKMKLR